MASRRGCVIITCSCPIPSFPNLDMYLPRCGLLREGVASVVGLSIPSQVVAETSLRHDFLKFSVAPRVPSGGYRMITHTDVCQGSPMLGSMFID